MNEMTIITKDFKQGNVDLPTGKFTDPDITAKGEARAKVAMAGLQTLWINTGTLCNIECLNCYIDSGPKKDQLAYMSAAEVTGFLDEIEELGLGTGEIGFTGGEPFMNPDIMAMLEDALSRGLDVLVLTNAMQPMQRKRVATALVDLNERYGDQLKLRVSLDHYTKKLHQTERGDATWKVTLKGLDWLSENGFSISLAGRTCWNEDEQTARAGYQALIAKHGWKVDAHDHGALVLFPEMDETVDVPEITTGCWDILKIDPSDMMCATSRMVIKRKGAAKPTVLPCTLIVYSPLFEMGSTFAQAEKAEGGMFSDGAVKLCHPHCAKFCVLGGGSCSAS